MIFGVWADRAGRRIPLLVDVSFYSVVGFLCAFAPNFTVLLVLRLLYGIGMGGEWGLGAALAMEKIPAARRGFFSGVLQQGYSLGYLLASLASLVVLLRAGPVVAVAVRPVDHPGVDQPAHPHPGAASPTSGEDTREEDADEPRRRSATCCSTRPCCAASGTSSCS